MGMAGIKLEYLLSLRLSVWEVRLRAQKSPELSQQVGKHATEGFRDYPRFFRSAPPACPGDVLTMFLGGAKYSLRVTRSAATWGIRNLLGGQLTSFPIITAMGNSHGPWILDPISLQRVLTEICFCRAFIRTDEIEREMFAFQTDWYATQLVFFSGVIVSFI
jgi:hypothetical protein